MQSSLMQASAAPKCSAFGVQHSRRPARIVMAQAKKNDVSEVCKRSAAALGAVLFISSPFAGPALARPSDFIQSKPSSTPGEPTNVDKFPFNPSTTGNKAGKDTEQQVNPQENPQDFSTTKGLGKAQTGSEASEPIPSPLDMGPDPQNVGKE